MKQVALGIQTDKTPAEYVALARLIDGYEVDVVHVYCDLPYTPSYLPMALMAPHLRRGRVWVRQACRWRAWRPSISRPTRPFWRSWRGAASAWVWCVAAGLGDYGIRQPERPLQAIREGVAVIRYMLSGETGGLEGDIYSLAEHAWSPWALPRGDACSGADRQLGAAALCPGG